MKKILAIAAILFILPLVCLGIWAAWEHLRDPLAALDYGLPEIVVASDSMVAVGEAAEARIYRDVVLVADGLDSIRFTVSAPAVSANRRLPVVMVIGGLEIGRTSLRYVGHHGDNVLIAYEYPYGPDYWYRGTPYTEIPALRNAVCSVPAQLEAILRWARTQPWADTNRICTFSYSFGAMFVPGFYRLVASRGDTLGPAALIYGGVDIERLLRNNLQIEPGFLRDAGAWLAATAIRPVEPALHLRYVKAELLIVNGTRDQLIPEHCWRELGRLAPMPKTVMTLDTEHMHPRATELIARLVDIGRQWLLECGAIEP